MKYFHDCGGIHAAGPAWDELGWECVGISEIEKFPIAVVHHHYPNLTQYGDTTKVKAKDVPPIDLLIGGTPCQGFSVAGKRGGLSDIRSNLAWNFLRLAAESRARWIIWENVPGASSTNEGRDLLAFFGQVEKLGYGFCSRTLDAQYFGVPQRRRRIFLVGHLGDWRPAAAVLFESQSLRGNFAPRRTTREGATRSFEIGPSGNRATDLAPTLDARCKDGPIRNQIGMAVAHPPTCGANRQADHTQENYILTPWDQQSKRITDSHGITPTLSGCDDAGGRHGPIIFENHAQDSRIKQVELCPQLNAKDGTGGNNLPLVMQQPQAFTQNQAGDVLVNERMHSLATNSNATGRNSANVLNHGTVRRLTPRECERLQGFPDDWTLIPYGKKQCPDGPRYKALGNSIAVPVLRHLGRQIEFVERLMRELA